MTYSILARDPDSGEIGGAVHSHFFAVGRRCLTVVPGVGAVASQAYGSAAHGPALVERMVEHGGLPARAVDDLLADDPVRPQRQVAALDAAGTAQAATGAGCLPNAAHAVGDGVVAAGNTLVSSAIPAHMVEVFATATGTLAERLLAALSAAEELGGDARGVMSAALRVVGPGRTAHVQDGTLVDLRVDHAPDPHAELARLLRVGDGHRRLVQAVLSPGRLVGTGRPPVEEVDAAVLDVELVAAQDALGDDPEPTFWRGVVALRRGDAPAARHLLGLAVAAHPPLHGVLAGVGRVGRAPVTAELLAELDPGRRD